MSAWQPIATAPKDGTAILVCVAGDDYYAAVVTRLPSVGPAEWRIPGTNRVLAYKPTHWMPLPEPPEERAG